MSSSVFLQGLRRGQGTSSSSCHHQQLSPILHGSLQSRVHPEGSRNLEEFSSWEFWSL